MLKNIEANFIKSSLVISLLVLYMFIGACDDSQNFNSGCTVEEYKESVANTECLAEEFLFGCNNDLCRGIDADFMKVGFGDCTLVDCQTLSCDRLQTDFGEPTQPGFLTELTVDDITGFPIGMFQFSEFEGRFICDQFIVGN